MGTSSSKENSDQNTPNVKPQSDDMQPDKESNKVFESINPLTNPARSHRVNTFFRSEKQLVNYGLALGSADSAEHTILELKERKLTKLLTHVARGEQGEAEAFLKKCKQNKSLDSQWFLKTPLTFTDYSGRTFNCTAYEYADWAKDTHMCRMLAKYMDEDTKAEILKQINKNDQEGLSYKEDGKDFRSAHFDFNPLKTDLQAYVDGYKGWKTNDDPEAIDDAWLKVGKNQRKVPAHVANEYCHPERSFDPTPDFKEESLPRILKFYNFITGKDEDWYPLPGGSEGLGFNFSVNRSWALRPEGVADGSLVLRSLSDLEAMCHLDEVRTEELKELRKHLAPREPEDDLLSKPSPSA